MRHILTVAELRVYQLGNGSLALERDDGGEVSDDEVARVLALLPTVPTERRLPRPASTIPADGSEGRPTHAAR